MEARILHIEKNGIAMVQFDVSDVQKLKDGQILSFSEQHEDTSAFDTSCIESCSVRIKSAILIYFHYVRLRNENTPAPFQNAVKKVAEELDISLSSVYDKFTRQIKCTASDFQNLLAKAYDGDITDFQKKLLDFTVNKIDESVIEKHLPKINQTL